jgi:hypothetical protein
MSAVKPGSTVVYQSPPLDNEQLIFSRGKAKAVIELTWNLIKKE